MALVVKDRVQETSTTTGTGTLTLAGAVTGYQTFSSAIGNTNTTYYAIQNGAEWEVGIGTVGAGTLSRDTVLESSNSGSLVNFSAGSKFVFCTYPAEKSVYVDSSGNVNLTGDILLDNGSADGAQLTLASSGYSNWNLDNYSGRFRAYYNATEYFTIDASGNVGIGTSTTNPALFGKGVNLDGTSNVGYQVSVGGTFTGYFGAYTSETRIGSISTYPMTFYTNSTERMRIDSSGNVGIGTSSPTAKLTVSGGGITSDGQIIANDSIWLNKPTLNYAYYTDAIAFSQSGTGERMRIDSSGNVGIGTSSPSGKLDVSGDMYLRDGGGNAVLYTTNGLYYRHGNSGSYTDVLLVDSSYNLKFNSGYGSAATAYGCRAWVNFNGTGTVAIRASGNVSSITDNGTGLYTVNFTNAMPDANYSVSITGQRPSTSGGVPGLPQSSTSTSALTTSGVQVKTYGTDVSNGVDYFQVCVAVIR